MPISGSRKSSPPHIYDRFGLRTTMAGTTVVEARSCPAVSGPEADCPLSAEEPQMRTLLASSDASSRKIGFGTLFDDLFLAHRPMPVRVEDEAVAGKIDFLPQVAMNGTEGGVFAAAPEKGLL